MHFLDWGAECDDDVIVYLRTELYRKIEFFHSVNEPNNDSTNFLL